VPASRASAIRLAGGGADLRPAAPGSRHGRGSRSWPVRPGPRPARAARRIRDRL